MRHQETFRDGVWFIRFIASYSDDDDGATEGQEEESRDEEEEDDALTAATAAHVNHTHSVSEGTEATVPATTPLLLDDGDAKTLSTPENPGTVHSGQLFNGVNVTA